MKIKFLGIFPVSRSQFVGIEIFFFILFFLLTIFFFSYTFPAYIDDPMILFHARFLKYAALLSTFFIVIESQYVFNSLVKQQKRTIELQNIELKSQKEEIATQLEIISEQKKNITDGIIYASTIQQALLPDFSEVIKNHEYFIFYRPKEIVSGDFYWCYNHYGRIIIAAADCTGHGVPGAFMSVLGITNLNEIMAKAPENISAAEILERLRSRVIKAFEKKNQSQQRKDGMDIALYIIEPDGKTLQFAGANNPLYIIRKNENDNFPQTDNKLISITNNDKFSLIQIKGDKMPIGNFKAIHPFTNHTLTILPDDRLYAFSDGYIDQFGGPYGKRLGTSTFKKLLLSIQDKNMESQKQILELTIDEWIKSNPDQRQEQIDDMLIIGLHIKEQ